MSLVKAYGEIWKADEVNWGNRGRGGRGTLLGRVDGKKPDRDQWDQRGVYILYLGGTLVYVGKAVDQPLGKRLQQHRRSKKLKNRWDRFSWYGFRAIKADGKLKNLPNKLDSSMTDAMVALEAILIAVTVPPQNQRFERKAFGAATQVLQQSPAQ